MSPAELRALLQLRCVPGLGDVKLGRLLREHGSARAVLTLPAGELGAHAEQRFAAPTLRRVERVLRVMDRLELHAFAVHRPDYPARLLTLHDAPALLFARGDTRLLACNGVAVVGTRHPTEYGLDATELLVSGLARAELVIWSGGARGVDALAHLTALECGGATVAVLGCGIDVAYPRNHAPLFEQIAAEGLLLSEFLPGEPPLAHNFPRRNRILARMPHGVLVIEAREASGALITAEHAEGHTTVMAVPGPIGRVTSAGPNRLIQDGAKLVMEVKDVLEELGGLLNADAARPRPSSGRRWRSLSAAERRSRAELRRATTAAAAAGNGGSRPAELPPGTLPARLERVYRVLGAEPIHIDAIARLAQLDAPRALGSLLELELDGHALCVGGKRYRLPPPHSAGARGPQPDPPPQPRG